MAAKYAYTVTNAAGVVVLATEDKAALTQFLGLDDSSVAVYFSRSKAHAFTRGRGDKQLTIARTALAPPKPGPSPTEWVYLVSYPDEEWEDQEWEEAHFVTEEEAQRLAGESIPRLRWQQVESRLAQTKKCYFNVKSMEWYRQRRAMLQRLSPEAHALYLKQTGAAGEASRERGRQVFDARRSRLVQAKRVAA